MKALYAHGIGPWLRSSAHHDFSLPYLVNIENDVALGKRAIAAYDLEWPGQLFVRHSSSGAHLRSRRTGIEDTIPGCVISHWRGTPGLDDMPVATWLGSGPFPGTPDLWPTALQYHVAVNWDLYVTQVDYMPRIPVAGIPHEVVQRVIQARFALDPAYLRTAMHLDHLSSSLHDDPFFEDFNTNVRESLFEIVQVVVRKLFMLLGDCIWDTDRGGWARGGLRDAWPQLAAYLWWVNRTGSGCYRNAAGIHRDSSPSACTSVDAKWKAIMDGEGDIGACLHDVLSMTQWDHRPDPDGRSGEPVTLIVKDPDDLEHLDLCNITGAMLVEKAVSGKSPCAFFRATDPGNPVHVLRLAPLHGIGSS